MVDTEIDRAKSVVDEIHEAHAAGRAVARINDITDDSATAELTRTAADLGGTAPASSSSEWLSSVVCWS